MQKLGFILFSGLFLASCTPKVEIPEINSGRANFTNYISIGDGYMAGYQDGALFHDGQMRSIAALIYTSLEQAGTVSYNQALMNDNVGLGISSKPWDATYVTSSTLNYKVQSFVRSVKRFVHGYSRTIDHCNRAAVASMRTRLCRRSGG